MIIQKVINNNVVSTFDTNNREVILMGKGIGFRKKAGDELDKNKIEKIFTLDQRATSPFVQEIMAIIQEFYDIWNLKFFPVTGKMKRMKKTMWNFTKEIRKNIRKLISAVRKS